MKRRRGGERRAESNGIPIEVSGADPGKRSGCAGFERGPESDRPTAGRCLDRRGGHLADAVNALAALERCLGRLIPDPLPDTVPWNIARLMLGIVVVPLGLLAGAGYLAFRAVVPMTVETKRR